MQITLIRPVELSNRDYRFCLKSLRWHAKFLGAGPFMIRLDYHLRLVPEVRSLKACISRLRQATHPVQRAFRQFADPLVATHQQLALLQQFEATADQ